MKFFFALVIIAFVILSLLAFSQARPDAADEVCDTCERVTGVVKKVIDSISNNQADSVIGVICDLIFDDDASKASTCKDAVKTALVQVKDALDGQTPESVCKFLALCK